MWLLQHRMPWSPWDTPWIGITTLILVLTPLPFLCPSRVSLLNSTSSWSVSSFCIDLRGPNEVCSLLKGFQESGFFFPGQWKLELSVSKAIKEGDISYSILQVRDEDGLLVEPLHKLDQWLILALLDLERCMLVLLPLQLPMNWRTKRSHSSWKQKILPEPRPLNHFCVTPFRVAGKYWQ